MFQAMLVKIRNTTASSIPAGLPWNVATKNTSAAGKKPRIGTDCRTSRTGSMITAAFLFVAAVVPDGIAKTRDKREGRTIRVGENKARRGKWAAFHAARG